LDPSEGHVYISRGIVFDENVFPFAHLHPNAGTRLRMEIALLPASLLPSSSTFGDAILRDQHSPNIVPTNPLSSACASPLNAEKNPVQIGEGMALNDPHFMCVPGGSCPGTRHKDDLPSASAGLGDESAPGSVPNSSPHSRVPTSGSSVASASPSS
jgi:hypothetical protein